MTDPVTCARHFDYQFNTFLKQFLMCDIAPLGKIKDRFYRVEYQQRGSLHIHMLIQAFSFAHACVGTRVNQITCAFIRMREQQNDTTLML